MASNCFAFDRILRSTTPADWQEALPIRTIEEVPYVVTEPCIGVKDKSCMTVCPVDCIYETDDQVWINPDECIDCGLCEPECPVNAIFVDSDVPENWREYIEKNASEGRRLAN